jgi:hypothetical protein
MKKAVMSFIGAMMILSLAACTPTTEKGKNHTAQKTETSTTSKDKSELVGGVDYERSAGSTVPAMDIVVIYTVKADGSGIEGTMESVDAGEMSEQSLADLLIEDGVLEAGTEVIDFSVEEDENGAAVVGPGVDASETATIGILNLNQLPNDGKDEMIVRAVARTFMENMDVEAITVQLNGEAVAEGLTSDDLE